jgi:metal-responsive CopG/Arc/MetJ family transcriptional regulator
MAEIEKPKSKFASVTILKAQSILAEEMGDALYGKKHGNRSRFIREAIDEKIERVIAEREKNNQ